MKNVFINSGPVQVFVINKRRRPCERHSTYATKTILFENVFFFFFALKRLDFAI